MEAVTRPDFPTVRQWMDYKRHLAELKAELELKKKLFAAASASHPNRIDGSNEKGQINGL
jgi:hypothetical protein